MFVTLETLVELNERIGRDNAGNPQQLAAVAMGSAFTFNTCAHLSRHDIAMPAPPQTDGKIIASVPCSHPDDFPYRKYVLVEYQGKFVSWLHNLQDGGFHEGHYTDRGQTIESTEETQDNLRSEALRLFAKRVARVL